MSPRTTSQTGSASRTNTWITLASLALILALSLLAFVSVLFIGYLLPDTSAKAYWFVSRSSGVVAYVLITLGVLWGLVQSGSLFRSRISPVLALGLHSYLNWLGLALSVLHGAILIGDGYINIDLARVLVPFISPYRPIPVGLGIVSLYLMLLLSLSFYARSYLGQKNFRLLHYGSFLVFLLVTAHSLFAGTDSLPLWWLYASSLALVIVFTFVRIIGARRAKKPSHAAPGRISRTQTPGAASLAASRRSARPARVAPRQR
jgi:predicted ferric reductase